jgi:hypothetical protein
MQLIAETPLGLTVAREYARRHGVSVETHVKERYGSNMSARDYGELVVQWLTDPPSTGVAFGVGEGGIRAMDEPPFAGRPGAYNR